MSNLFRNLNALRFVVLAVMLALLAASHAAFAPEKANACMYGYEYHIRYYSDDTYSQIVGFCQGDSCTNWEYCDGERTPHLISNTYTILCC